MFRPDLKAAVACIYQDARSQQSGRRANQEVRRLSNNCSLEIQSLEKLFKGNRKAATQYGCGEGRSCAGRNGHEHCASSRGRGSDIL